MTLVDPLGRILTEIRDDPAVAAITTRIRGGEPAPGDALGPGSYLPFVVLTRLGGLREKRLPIQEVRLNVASYGVTAQGAAALAGACSDAIHGIGPCISTGGVGIWVAFDDGDAGAVRDPDTQQWREDFVVSITAATELIP
jgi:hypothetical protein